MNTGLVLDGVTAQSAISLSGTISVPLLTIQRLNPALAPIFTRSHITALSTLAPVSRTQWGPMTTGPVIVTPGPIRHPLPMIAGGVIIAEGFICTSGAIYTFPASRLPRRGLLVFDSNKFEGTRVHPVAAEGIAENTFFRIKEAREKSSLEHVVSVRWYFLQNIGLKDIDTGINPVGGGLGGRGLLNETLHAAGNVGLNDAESAGVIHPLKGYGGGGIIPTMKSEHIS
jgi:hypothetical protein